MTMTFIKAGLKADPEAIDILNAWVATNTPDGVAIVKNSKGEFELWTYTQPDPRPLFMTPYHLFANYPKSLKGIYDTFNTARREAECIFDMTVPASQ